MIGYYLMPHPPIMIPEIGKGKETEINRTLESCKEIGKRIKEQEVETIIIITPHGPVFRDAVGIFTTDRLQGNLGRFGAKEVEFNYEVDSELVHSIIKNSEDLGIIPVGLDEASCGRYGIELELDHGVSVPLYYAAKDKKYKLVHITYGMLSPIDLVRFGVAIKKAVEKESKNIAIIASGDLSHRLREGGPYPYSPAGEEFDYKLLEILSGGNMEKLFSIDKSLIEEAGECGLRSVYILAGAMNTLTVKGELLSYEGTFGVGYAVMAFHKGEGDLLGKLISSRETEHIRRMEEGNPYTKLARRNLNNYFNKGRNLNKDDIEDKELLVDKKGVFVSLKINGELRGCIGTIAPTTDCVGEEIIKNSISAAFSDPRFPQVRREELSEIDISVDLLYPSEKCTFNELDPREYGVIVSYESRRGLLLPMLEGVDTKEQQVKIALQKGGIPEDAEFTIERFKVERYKEVEKNA